MSILATCLTLLAAVVSAPSGSTVRLQDQCGPVEISAKKDRVVTIDATGSTIKGLRLTGQNITWKGGKIQAKDGETGFAGNGYGVYITGRGNSLTWATVTNARKGVVIDKAIEPRVAYTNFVELLEDGIIASNSSGMMIEQNNFMPPHPKPTTCTLADGTVITALAQRDCLAKFGKWVDGNHADGIQMRNAVVRTTIRYNFITGPSQGIAQMDTTGDLPLSGVKIYGNVIVTDGYHHITLGPVCSGCVIYDNFVLRQPGSTKKAVIHAGGAKRCGNHVQDEKIQDVPCT